MERQITAKNEVLFTYSYKKHLERYYVLEEVIKFDLKCFKIHNSRVLGLSAPNDQVIKECRCLER